MMEVRVSDMWEYAYIVKNSEAADKNPKKKAYIIVVSVKFISQPFAKNKQTQAIIALMKFAWNIYDGVSFIPSCNFFARTRETRFKNCIVKSIKYADIITPP